MNKYICLVCGGVSYSAAGPEALIDDGCIEDNCPGKVEMEETGDEN